MPSVEQPPEGVYSQPARKLVRCPHCDKALNHHVVADGVAAEPVSINVNRKSSPIRLFGEPVTPTPAPPQELVASGDIVVASPAMTMPHMQKEFEQVTTGQARPHKRETHAIPGAPRKPVVVAPDPPPPAVKHPGSDFLKVLDHPLIGGKVTICVLLYGEQHHALHRRCLTSIVQTVPPSRMDLRVGCNEIGLETTNYLRSLPISKVYEKQNRNLLKYPLMRWMFHDTEKPINTNYVIWFDDDSYVLNERWLAILGEVITAQRPQDRVGCYGHRMIHPLNSRPTKGDPRQWFRNANWFRGVDFQDRRGRVTPNGMHVHFPVGGFWCISHEAIRVCDIPDSRLRHNGGDITIGEQLHQNGFKVKMFNDKKEYIKTSGAARRGFHEKFQWHK